MKKLTLVMTLTVIVVLLTSVLALAAPAEKRDVCHVEGNGTYIKINISENAFDSHVAHGDAAPGDPVPGMEGFVFDDDCYPVASGPTVEPGYSSLTPEAGVRFRGNSTGNEIYLGFGNLGTTTRVEAVYPNVTSNWPDGTYSVMFQYDGASTITTVLTDSNGGNASPSPLVYTNATPVCGSWDVLDILVLDRLTTGAIAFNNVELNGTAIGDFGTFDITGAPGSISSNWTVKDFDFSQPFTITGDLVVAGWTGSEQNKLQLTVGCSP